jgi:hypothetical protein
MAMGTEDHAAFFEGFGDGPPRFVFDRSHKVIQVTAWSTSKTAASCNMAHGF